MSSSTMTASIPDHVPESLVRDFNFYTASGMAMTPNGDPHAALAQLRDLPPIFYSPENTRDNQGTWILTRIEDMRIVLQDAETYSSHRAIFSSAIGETWPLVPLELDPPAHTAYRSLLNPLLSPKRVAALGDSVRNRAIELIEKFEARGECEVMSEFAFPFAVSIFLQFLGLPQTRMPEFLHWATKLLHPDTPDERRQAALDVIQYLDELAELRRREPTDDFISYVVQAEVNGKKMTDAEVRGMSVLLFIAGLDTVAAAVGFDLLHLARNPVDQALLRDEPERIPNAIEEMLRAYSTVQMIRKAQKDTELCGIQIKAGDLVCCPSMVANRDESEYPDPDQIDFDRNANRHMAFAYGVHRCLGSHLARRELITAIEEWYKRIPSFRLKAGKPPVTYGGFVFGVEALHLEWDVA